MAYWDFVFFVISEEDKTTTRSIEYWFRVMDLDGDGLLSVYELELLYNCQLEKFKELRIEAMPFQDILRLTLDMVSPKHATYFTLADVKRTQMAPQFLNMFINAIKYVDQENSSGLDTDDDEVDVTPWQRFALNEYVLLSNEEDDEEDDEGEEAW
eukprot:m.213143 g.213143  ORF g.213143 m.213143 type:complete len:155 (+) comp15081_c0_seq1:1244-1708(+)